AQALSGLSPEVPTSQSNPAARPAAEDISAGAVGTCARDMRGAITLARQALREASGEFDRIALGCLIEAVGALGERVQGLSDGSVAFDGPIHIRKGFVIVKPRPGEAE